MLAPLSHVALLALGAIVLVAPLAGWAALRLLHHLLPQGAKYQATARTLALPLAMGGTLLLATGAIMLLYTCWFPPREPFFLLCVVATCGCMATALAVQVGVRHTRATFPTLLRMAERGFTLPDD